ncbi:hypothetical protein DERF_001689, partial [Dermatophagoides farinae]
SDNNNSSFSTDLNCKNNFDDDDDFDHCNQCGRRRESNVNNDHSKSSSSSNNQRFFSINFFINHFRLLQSILSRKNRQSIEQQQRRQHRRELDSHSFVENFSVDLDDHDHHSISNDNVVNVKQLNSNKTNLIVQQSSIEINNENNNNRTVIEKCSSSSSSSSSTSKSSINSLSNLPLKTRPSKLSTKSSDFCPNTILADLNHQKQQKMDDNEEKVVEEKDDEDDDDDDITEISPPAPSLESSSSSAFFRDLKREQLSHDNGHRIFWTTTNTKRCQRFDNVETNLPTPQHQSISKDNYNDDVDNGNNPDSDKFNKSSSDYYDGRRLSSPQPSLPPPIYSSPSSSITSTLSMFSSASNDSKKSKENDQTKHENRRKLLKNDHCDSNDDDGNIAYYNQLTLMSLQPSVVAVDGNVASENILFSTLQENQEIVNVECQQQSKQHCRQNIKSPSPISLSPQQQQQQHSSSSSSLLSTSKSFCLMPENHFFDVNVKVEYIDFPSKNSIQKNCFVTKSNVENGKNVQMTNNFLDTDVQQRQQQQKMDKQRSNSVNDVCGICIKQQQQQSTDETTMAIPVSNKSSTKSLNLVKTTKNDHRKRKTIINNDHHQPQRKLSKCKSDSNSNLNEKFLIQKIE